MKEVYNIVKFPKDLSLLFCTSTWPPWRHVKTESKFQDNTVNDNEHDDDNINFFFIWFFAVSVLSEE